MSSVTTHDWGVDNAFAADTTYADGRFVYKVDVSVSGGFYVVAGVPYWTHGTYVPKPDYDSALYLSYDSIAGLAILDSTTADAVSSTWYYSMPVALYDIDVPKAISDPGDLAAGDLGTLFAMTVADSQVLVDLVGYSYLDSSAFTTATYDQMDNYDSLFLAYSEFFWGDWVGDSTYMRFIPQLVVWGTVVDSTSGNSDLCYPVFNYHNYYDRVISYYSYWWRTGNTTIKERADSYARVYVRCLYTAHGGTPFLEKPRDYLPEGVIAWAHAGSNDAQADSAMYSVAKNAAYLEQFYLRRNYWGKAGEPDNTVDDGRVQGRSYLAALVAKKFNFDDSISWAGDWDSTFAEGRDSMNAYIDVGSRDAWSTGFFPMSSYGDGMTSWQISQSTLHSMIREVEWGFASPAREDSIVNLVAAFADTSWAIGWQFLPDQPWYDNQGGSYKYDSLMYIYTAQMDTTHGLIIFTHPADSAPIWFQRHNDSVAVSNWVAYDTLFTDKWKARVTTDPVGIAMNSNLLTEGSDTSSLANLTWVWVADTLYLRRDAGDPSTEDVVRIKALTTAAAYDSFWNAHSHDSLSSGDAGFDVRDKYVHYRLPPEAAHTVFSSHSTRYYDPEPHQNGMMAYQMAWAWKKTGDSTYWHRADSLLDGMMHSELRSAAAWPYNNGKIPNEQYYLSQTAIHWLANPDGTILEALGITTAESTALAEILGFPYRDYPVSVTDWANLAVVDSLFEYWSDYFWPQFQALADTTSDGTGYGYFYGHNRYDKAKAHYQYWWRTGDEKWKGRADSLAYMYVNRFMVPPCYNAEWYLYPEGLWAHYFATGDTITRQCMAEQTDLNWWVAKTNYGASQNVTGAYDDGRLQGRSALSAMMLGKYWPAFVGRSDLGSVTAWDTVAANTLDSLLAFAEQKSTSIGVIRSYGAYCGGMSVFQTMHATLYAMMRYNEFVDTFTTVQRDSVKRIVKGTIDTVLVTWGTDQQINGIDAYGFPYIIDIPDENQPCGNDSTINAGLLMINAAPFAFYSAEEPDSAAKYIAWLDSLVNYSDNYSMEGWPYNLGKEQGESYYNFYSVLVWLDDVLP